MHIKLIYQNSLVWAGHHGNEHVKQNCYIADVKASEYHVAEHNGELVFEWMYLDRFAVANQVHRPKHGAKSKVNPGGR